MAEPFFKIHSAHTTALWHQSPLYSYATFISFRTKVILGFLINTSHTCALNAQKKQTKKTIAFLITRNASTHCQVGKTVQSHKDTANRTEERQVRFVPHRVKNGIFCFVASIMNKTLIFFHHSTPATVLKANPCTEKQVSNIFQTAVMHRKEKLLEP